MLLLLLSINLFITSLCRSSVCIGALTGLYSSSNTLQISLDIHHLESSYLIIQLTPNEKTQASAKTSNLDIVFSSSISDYSMVIPKAYYLPKNELFIDISCNNKCDLKILAMGYEIIPIAVNQRISFLPVEEGIKYKYAFYNDDASRTKRDVHYEAFVYSNDFEGGFESDITVIDVNTEKEVQEIDRVYKMNHAIEASFVMEKDTYILFTITIKKQKKSFLTIYISQIDNVNNEKQIQFNVPIYEVINKNKICYLFNNKDEQKYLIDFFSIYNDYGLSYEDNEQQIIIDHPLSIIYNNKNKKFCFSNSKGNAIFFTFIVHKIEEDNNMNQSMIGLIPKGDTLRRIIGPHQCIFYGIRHQKEINVYIKVIRGYLEVDKKRCNTYPFCYCNNESVDSVTDYSINNEYFIRFEDEDIDDYNTVDMLNLHCFDQISCEVLLLTYSDMDDIIHIIPNEKISLMNVHRKHYVIHSLSFNENDINTEHIILSSYTYYGDTKYSFKSDFYTSNVDTDYIGDNKHTTLTNDASSPIYNSLICSYSYNAFTKNVDYTSFVIQSVKSNQKVKNIIRLWMNDDIMISLSNQRRTRIVIENENKKRFTVMLSMIGCKIDIEANGKLHYIRMNGVNFYYLSLHNASDFVVKMIDHTQDDELDFKLDKCTSHFVAYESHVSTDDLTSYHLDNKDRILLHENEIHHNIIRPVSKNEEYIYLNNIYYSFLLLSPDTDLIIIEINFTGEHFIDIVYFYSSNPNQFSTLTAYHSRTFIIKPSIYTKKKDAIVKLCLTLSSKDQKNSEPFEFSIALSTNNHRHRYLPRNYLQSGIIINNVVTFYYSDITYGESGTVILNHKKGSGLLYGKIISNDYFIKNDDAFTKTSTSIGYDVNTNSLRFEKKDTSNCINTQCTLIIAVISNDDKNSIIVDTIYEYSLVLYFTHIDISPIYLLPNEYIQNTIYSTPSIIIYEYDVPMSNQDDSLQYEIKCSSCFISISKTSSTMNRRAVLNQITSRQYDSTYTAVKGTFTIKDRPTIFVVIEPDSIDDIYYTTFQFKLIERRQSMEMLLSENDVYCGGDGNCKYAMPIYIYDGLSELVISVSDENYNSVNDVIMKASLFTYDDFYLLNDTDRAKMSFAQHKNNYLVLSSSFFSLTDLILIFDIEKKSKENYHVFFTYDKKSRTKLLSPNKRTIFILRENEKKELKIPFVDNPSLNVDDYYNSTILSLRLLKGSGVLILKNENQKYIPFDSSHKYINIVLNSLNTKSDLNIIGKELMYFYSTLSTKPNDNLNVVNYGDSSSIVFHKYNSEQRNAIPLMVYAYNNESNQNDITFNIRIDYEKDESRDYSLKGFLVNENYIDKRKKNHNLAPEFNKIVNGHFDKVMKYGIVTFNRDDIEGYQTQFKKLLLLRLDDKNRHNNKIVDKTENVIVKVMAMPSKSNIASLPSGEYFYSQIQYKYKEKEYNAYKLSKSDIQDEIMKIEFATCYGQSTLSLHTSMNDNDIYSNSQNINILSDEIVTGKRVILLEQTVNDIFVYIYPDNDEHVFLDEDTIHFVIKYTTYQKSVKDEYTIEQKVKSYYNIHLNESELKWNITSIQRNLYQEENTKYYIRLYSRNKFKSVEEINSICLYNHPLKSYTTSIQSIKVDELSQYNGDLYINIISISNDNIIAYNSLKINKYGQIDNQKGWSFGLGTIILILIISIFAMLIVTLCLYKTIRKIQVQHAYKLIDERKKNKGKIMIEKDNELKNTLPKNLSFLIDSESNN